MAGSSTELPLTGSVAVVSGLLFVLASGCQQKVKVGKVGKTLSGGDIEVSVKDWELRHLEVVEDKRTFQYGDPVLAVEVKFSNTGKKPFRYAPTHAEDEMSESETPLLYEAPGKDESLPPKKKIPVKGVVLDEGELDSQITSSTQIEPGKSITDVMLFEMPEDKKADLIFSVPPSMHGGQQPLLFKMSYERHEPKGPKAYSKGETANFDGVQFSVVSSGTEYVEVKNPSDGKGYSSDPVFKIEYRVKNKSDKSIAYEPGHNAVAGRRAPSLYGGGDAFPRVRFSSNTSVVGQITGKENIDPGDEVEDVAVFERPGKGVEQVRFEFPASRVGRSGIIRYMLDYKYEEPEKPDEISDE